MSLSRNAQLGCLKASYSDKISGRIEEFTPVLALVPPGSYYCGRLPIGSSGDLAFFGCLYLSQNCPHWGQRVLDFATTGQDLPQSGAIS